MTDLVMKKAVNPDTGQHYMIELPAPEVVRQAILELEYPAEGLRVVHATEKLAEKFQLSNEQKGAKNSSDLNVFRYDVVAPQFKRLLREGELEQPKGPRTPYVLAEIDPPDKPKWLSVERTALHPDTGEEYQIALPATDVLNKHSLILIIHRAEFTLRILQRRWLINLNLRRNKERQKENTDWFGNAT